MDMMMTSSSSKKASSNNNTATASADHHQKQEQESISRAPQVVEARNLKKARRQAATSGSWECKKPRAPPQLDEPLRCPRCDSSNTKFSYYNNYNLSQPRYLCKACSRFWTQGGSLRNVPVGSGCRKNKRSSASLSSSSSSSTTHKQQEEGELVPASWTAEPPPQDFPNVLPTSMSTSFELPKIGLPPFTPPSSSTLAPALDSGAGMMMMPSFLDMLKGGFLDYQANSSYQPMSSCMETPSSFGFNVVMQHGMGAAPPTGGGGASAGTHQGGQRQATQVGPIEDHQEGASVSDATMAK